MHRSVHKLAHLFDALNDENGLPLGFQSPAAEPAGFSMQVPPRNLDQSEPSPDGGPQGTFPPVQVNGTDARAIRWPETFPAHDGRWTPAAPSKSPCRASHRAMAVCGLVSL